MSDTFSSIWNAVHGHSQSVDPLLVQSWVRDTWREIAEARTWSWLRKRSRVYIPAPYTTGTVTIVYGSNLLTFSGATLSLDMEGRQFRLGTTGGIYNIQSVDTSAGTARLTLPWQDDVDGASAQSYRIFTAYITPPDSQFFAWLAVTDPSHRKRLRLHVNQETIDYHDANRQTTSIGPACLSGVDWTDSYAGRVYSTLRVVGSGPTPTATGTYVGAADALYVITITTGGAVDTAVFSYRKNSETTVSGVTVSSSGNILPEGVELTWPAGTYVLNNVFIVRVSARPQYGVPRYEIYPHPTAELVLPCLYATRVTDIDEPSFVLPYTMRGDVIKMGTLAKMARYPGTEQRPNPFAQLARAQHYEDKFNFALAELVTADDFIMETNVSDPTDSWEYSLLPWMSASGYGLYPTPEYDPRDNFLR